MMGFSWHPDAVDFLRECWERGLSASRCARAINEEFGTHLSRNAVIGKAHRLGLAQRERNVVRPRAVAPKPRQIKRPATPAKLTVGASFTALEIKSTVQPVTLTELRPHHCRWPLGDPRLPDFRYCGARRLEPQPYCHHHTLIAYQPALKRKERAA